MDPEFEIGEIVFLYTGPSKVIGFCEVISVVDDKLNVQMLCPGSMHGVTTKWYKWRFKKLTELSK